MFVRDSPVQCGNDYISFVDTLYNNLIKTLWLLKTWLKKHVSKLVEGFFGHCRAVLQLNLTKNPFTGWTLRGLLSEKSFYLSYGKHWSRRLQSVRTKGNISNFGITTRANIFETLHLQLKYIAHTDTY